MDLNEEQKNIVKTWVDDGATLSEVQKKISSEFDISMTYMDVRFLVIDLGANLQDKEEPAKPEPDVQEDLSAPPQGGGVSVDVDRITSPGSLVSGTVVFTDGVSAAWALDQQGRLTLDAGDPEYRPTEENIQLFQEKLKGVLETRGF